MDLFLLSYKHSFTITVGWHGGKVLTPHLWGFTGSNLGMVLYKFLFALKNLTQSILVIGILINDTFSRKYSTLDSNKTFTFIFTLPTLNSIRINMLLFFFNILASRTVMLTTSFIEPLFSSVNTILEKKGMTTCYKYLGKIKL